MTKSNDSWSRVYLIEGEGKGCALALEAVCQQLNARCVRVENDIEVVKAACTAFPLGSQKQVIVVMTPNSELAQALHTIANGSTARCAGLVAYYPDSYADKRTTFVSEAHKRKRVYEYHYHLVSEPEVLRTQIKDWESRSGVTIAVKAKPWLVEHAPVRKADVRGSKGSKEEIVYDIPSLESDLDKLAEWALSRGETILSVDDLQKGVYQSTINNQWDFSDSFISGTRDVFTIGVPDQNYVGLTRMLLSQCHFVAQVKALELEISRDADDAARKFGGAEIIQNYTNLGGQSEGYKSQHPFRVKMAARKFKNTSLARVISLINLCNAATIDMVNGFNPEIVFNMLLLSAVDNTPYLAFTN